MSAPNASIGLRSKRLARPAEVCGAAVSIRCDATVAGKGRQYTRRSRRRFRPFLWTAALARSLSNLQHHTSVLRNRDGRSGGERPNWSRFPSHESSKLCPYRFKVIGLNELLQLFHAQGRNLHSSLEGMRAMASISTFSPPQSTA